MALPVNINELVSGNTIEWERLEFKQGWNPEDVIHTMCAFANDLHNWGGGYIIVGIAERYGQPILPPKGLKQNQLDSIQKKIIELGHKIMPNYFPIAQPYVIDGQHIVVVWCPAGDNRPYGAPESLTKGAQRFPYVRMTSNSVRAKGENLKRLQELAARIPFDDRVNNRATLDDLDLGLIREYLQEIKSSLLEESALMPFPDLCRAMLIAKGPNEDLRPVNVGLLFFNKKPETFFPRTRFELVWFKNGPGKEFSETYFNGPLHHQIKDALSFIKTNILKEHVVKLEDKAESIRFFNYPFEAIEEALSNAIYHKSYEVGSPIEIQIHPNKIEILSHPGPVPPVNAEILSTKKHIVAREYRNRRIGDFLKELHLTEGRGTGFPTIYNAMATNGSPEPSFETDDATYVLVTLAVHNEATNEAICVSFSGLDEIIEFSNGVNNGATNQAAIEANNIIANELHTRARDFLNATKEWVKRSELFDRIGLSNQSANRKKYLDPLIEIGWVKMEFHDTPTHPEQRYKATKSGNKILNTMNQL